MTRKIPATPAADAAQALALESISEEELDGVVGTRIEWTDAVMTRDGLYRPLPVDGPCFGISHPAINHNPDAVKLHLENQPASSTPATRATLREARAVSNGDTPPCWALVCPNPECGDVDTLHGTFVDITAFRRRPLLTILEMTCTSCGEVCRPPTRLEK